MSSLYAEAGSSLAIAHAANASRCGAGRVSARPDRSLLQERTVSGKKKAFRLTTTKDGVRRLKGRKRVRPRVARRASTTFVLFLAMVAIVLVAYFLLR